MINFINELFSQYDILIVSLTCLFTIFLYFLYQYIISFKKNEIISDIFLYFILYTLFLFFIILFII